MVAKSDDRPRTEIFVRSIPPEVTTERLGEFFSDFAPVKHATVVTDKETGESKRFGFVAFATPEDAAAAKEQGGRTAILPKRFLQIDIAKPRQRQDGKRAAPAAADDDREKRKPRLLVRNCPWSLRDPQELVKLFSRFGKVVDAYIPRGANNRMSGFAFVTMKRKKHAKQAIEASKDLKIHGRAVSVTLAVEKAKWESRAGANGDDDDDEDDDDSSDDEADEKDAKRPLHERDEIALDDENDEDEDEDGEDDEGAEDDLEDLEGDLDGDLEDASEAEEDIEEDAASATEEKPRRARAGAGCTIFVRNVPYDADAESLEEHFSQFGPVLYALPVMDKEKNQPKGTAFVAFRSADACAECVSGAPEITAASLLVPDDVDARYVFEGRVLNVARAVERDTADRLAEKRSGERLQALGKGPKIQDKRRLFLLNEGRIAPGSRLGTLLSRAELELREKSFKLRKQQLTKNPTLHLSMTRLAIRNLPRAMDEKALKALARKAVVEFATEVRAGQRQPLTKEEVLRSTHYQDSLSELGASSSKKHGVVKQSKIIQELKGSGKAGRSRGYGFLEMRDHRTALMALRWLNAHPVSKQEIAAGDGEAEPEATRRLVVEFAVENAQVVKRQRERQYRAKEKSLKRKAEDAQLDAARAEIAPAEPEAAPSAAAARPGNSYVGRKRKQKKLKRG